MKGLRRWLLTASLGIAILGTVNIWARIQDLNGPSDLYLTTQAEITTVQETDNLGEVFAVFDYRYGGKNRMGSATMPASISSHFPVGKSVLVRVNPSRTPGRIPAADEMTARELLQRNAVALLLASFLFTFLAARLRERVHTSKRYASHWLPTQAKVSPVTPGLWKYQYTDEHGTLRTHYKLGRLPRNGEHLPIFVNPARQAEHVTSDSLSRYVQIEDHAQTRVDLTR